MSDGPIYGTTVAALVLVGLFVWWVYVLSTKPTFRELCEAQGGEVLTKWDAGIGISTGGNVVITPVRMDFCLKDGKVLQ